jgi:RNA polymerase sigma-70 factor, ECF subfamily
MSASQPSTTVDRPEPGASWAATIERLQSFVAARVGDRELAADLTQDVILRSIQSGALDRVDNPSAWLYRSARNAVIDHYRTKRVHRPLPESDDWPDPDLPGNGPNEATRELAHCLQPLLLDLPEAAREALTRVDLKGETHQHAADELGTGSPAAARSSSTPQGPCPTTGPMTRPAAVIEATRGGRVVALRRRSVSGRDRRGSDRRRAGRP